VELTTFIALASLMTRSNTALGIESQEFAAARPEAARRGRGGLTGGGPAMVTAGASGRA
jgi:hypothetical protein